MVAVLTGDIINSRESKVPEWLEKLKIVLCQYGDSPEFWEIFRGDTFQLLVPIDKAFLVALHIKAVIKQTGKQDVRIAIGLGEESYHASKITESNGSAYVRSGESFDLLKKQTLILNTANHNWDEDLNLMLSLIELIANNWSATVAKVITTVLENPNKNQKEIAGILNKSQSSISEALKRAGFEEIMNVNTYYQNQLSNI